MWLKPNVALDAKKDWSITDSGALLEATALDANMRASADGARRGDGHSAAGLTIMAYHADGRRVLLHRSSRLWVNLPSVFFWRMLWR